MMSAGLKAALAQGGVHANTQLLNEVTEALDVVSGHREGLRLEVDDKLYPLQKKRQSIYFAPLHRSRH